MSRRKYLGLIFHDVLIFYFTNSRFFGADTGCRLASDSNSSAVILYQPSSRKAALVRNGDVVYGLLSFSKTEPSPRARACVILEMVHPEQRLALTQQLTSKHDDLNTVRQYVESVAFADMDEKAHVLGDSK